MIVRNYQESDKSLVRGCAEQFGYDAPDLESKAFVASRIIEHDGKAVFGAAARLTVEIYGFGSPEWGTPGMRLEALRILHAEIQKELEAKGLHDAHAWLPPEIAHSFGRRLMKSFGWSKQLWPCFCKRF